MDPVVSFRTRPQSVPRL